MKEFDVALKAVAEGLKTLAQGMEKIAEKLEVYVLTDGNPKYDLRDFGRYPKSLAALDFDIRL